MLPGLMAVSSAAGAEIRATNKWEFYIGLSETAPAIAGDGTIYVGTFRQELLALDPNGAVKWRFKTGSEIKSSPAIGTDGTIYFGCRDRKLYAVSPRGKEKWEFAAGAWVDSSPAIGADGTLYFGSWDKRFYALNPDGSLKWKFETGGEIESSPAVGADETIYFGSHDRKLYALARDGRKRWEFATGGQIISSPALNGDGVVYFTSVDGFFHALNGDGSLRWRLQTCGSTESSPVLAPDGTIYVGANHALLALTPEGKNKWDWILGGSLIQATPTVLADNSVCIMSPWAALGACDAGGRGIWRYPMSRGNVAPAVGVDGTIYAPGQNDSFFALDRNQPLARSPWPKFRANLRNTGHVALIRLTRDEQNP
jgi:outer membrane protein assembly factor BamB